MELWTFEIDFDIAWVWNQNVYNVLAYVDTIKLNEAKNTESIKTAMSYAIKKILTNWDNNATINEIASTNNKLTKDTSEIISSLVWILLHIDDELNWFSPEWKFHFRVNALNKITLH